MARILVVDDSLVIRKAIEKKLQHEFELVMASDGEAGWSALQADAVRVLVTDIEMPRLDGCALISRIRASHDPHIRDIPIIAMTGADDDATKERVLACGATDFLVKPIDPMQLGARVHSLTRLDLATRQLAASQAALQDQSTLDPLTGLSSRRYFQQSCQQNLAYAVRHGQDLALVRLEIDGFKSVYRQLGDDRVDQVLIWLAGILAATCRREDTVARIGGADFAVMAPATDHAKAQALCHRLLQAVVHKIFVSGDTEIPITLSVGAVTLEQDGNRGYEALMQVAERRVRLARNAGGDRVVTADAAAAQDITEDLSPVVLEALPLPSVSPDDVPLVLPEGMEWPVPVFEGRTDRQDKLLIDTAMPVPEIMDATLPAPAFFQADGIEDLAQIGLDNVLARLANNEGATIEPWLDSIAQRLLPLLEFYSERRAGVLAAGIAQIKTQAGQDRR